MQFIDKENDTITIKDDTDVEYFFATFDKQAFAEVNILSTVSPNNIDDEFINITQTEEGIQMEPVKENDG